MGNLVAEIETFLRSNNRPFSYGLELYERAFGNKGNLSKYKYASFIPGNAKTELRAGLAKALKFLSATYSTKAAEEIRQNFKDQAEEIPPKISQARKELKRIYKRSSFIHGAMVQEALAEARQDKLFAYAKEMMEEIQPEINRFSEMINTYKKSGRLIGYSSLEADKAVELIKRINSLRSSISRYKRLRRAENDKLKQMYYERKINEKKEALETSQRELDNF